MNKVRKLRWYVRHDTLHVFVPIKAYTYETPRQDDAQDTWQTITLMFAVHASDGRTYTFHRRLYAEVIDDTLALVPVETERAFIPANVGGHVIPWYFCDECQKVTSNVYPNTEHRWNDFDKCWEPIMLGWLCNACYQHAHQAIPSTETPLA